MFNARTAVSQSRNMGGQEHQGGILNVHRGEGEAPMQD